MTRKEALGRVDANRKGMVDGYNMYLLINEIFDYFEEVGFECGGCIHWDGSMCLNPRVPSFQKHTSDGCEEKEVENV